MGIMSWERTFFDFADVAAKRSKDQSTKLGAVITTPDHVILSTGYNSFPRGINDNLPERQERPEKYFWFEHAERNAIYNAARSVLKGTRIYVQMHPCCGCARGIINTGISEIIIPTLNVPERWSEEMNKAAVMLDEAGVKVRVHER